EQQPEPQESSGVLPESGTRPDGEAEQKERGCAEHEDGDRLRPRAPLQQQLFLQRGDHAMTRPFSSARCTSANRATRSTWCVAMMTVAPDAFSSPTTSSTSANPSGSSCPNGSSRKAIDGICSSTRANESRLRMPAEYVETGSAARFASPTRASTASESREISARFSRALSDSYR